ncbi:cytochrome P450 [Actinoalloteichus hoggarensis]|uniref:Cytochrome P450 107B1 n=1 Tax=Actinoalloteichus hoggarensis TaxID=1470176 RepID=A0A221W7U0_9PSEU|nr:cytochrome P450 [Actinoalloteichus hoggarensis]ASO21706.1 Cytochrome P450 107B1 [Actinoalloteichus hoggarensis]MBB5922300.1 cytochrome P450 [Actinoalloteichus hoggarensis]
MTAVGMEGRVPEIDLSNPEVLRDPWGHYGTARERSPLARLLIPGLGAMWALLRHGEARSVLSDPRFELNAGGFARRPAVAEEYLPYLRTMQELEGREHHRLRALVAPAFTARRARAFRPGIARIVDRLLDALPDHVEDGRVDLRRHFTRALPMAVICELVGIPEPDRPRWEEYGAIIAAGDGAGLAEAVPGIVRGAKAAVAARRAEPADDLISDLLRAQSEDGERLDDVELVTLIWNVVLAGQTPTHLIANAVAALFDHPEQLAALRADEALLPGAVEELIRWCGPQLLAIPRQAREDVEIDGTLISKGDRVTAALAAVNRDPAVFVDPHRLDLRRPPGPAGHLGFLHGPHFCLGAAIARVQTQVALGALLRRFPRLAPAGEPQRVPDPGSWRLAALPVTL